MWFFSPDGQLRSEQIRSMCVSSSLSVCFSSCGCIARILSSSSLACYMMMKIETQNLLVSVESVVSQRSCCILRRNKQKTVQHSFIQAAVLADALLPQALLCRGSDQHCHQSIKCYCYHHCPHQSHSHQHPRHHFYSHSHSHHKKKTHHHSRHNKDPHHSPCSPLSQTHRPHSHSS